MLFQRDGNKYFDTRYTSEFKKADGGSRNASGFIERTHDLAAVFGKGYRTIDAKDLYQNAPPTQTM